MTGAPTQFSLDLPHETGYDAGDFMAADCNLAARRLIEDWSAWPAGAAAIWGAPGAGKTHLAHIWRARATASLVDGTALGALDLAALADPVRLALDFGETPLADADEVALFHLLNIVRERRGGLLIVARVAPARWPVALADLGSRLRALPTAEAAAPDDGLFAAVLAKHFADRQLVVDRQTVDYLTVRSERSFAAARDLAARLDRAALARRRRINVKLAGDVLAEIEAERGEGI